MKNDPIQKIKKHFKDRRLNFNVFFTEIHMILK